MTNKYTIAEIKALLQNIDSIDHPFIAELKLDSRKGSQAAFLQWQKKQEKKKRILEQRQVMLIEEKKLQRQGFQIIAGVDEVGRGPLAGPVVAAAVIMPPDLHALPINDSKMLSASLREQLYDIILEHAAVGIGVVEPEIIDERNIYEATKIAMEKSIANLPVHPDALLIDAMKLALPIKQVSLIKGDARSYSIAAASIVAKVYRDRLMKDFAAKYPHYGFESNAGYGTKVHLEGLEKYGATPIHRKTFEPIKSLLKK